MAASKILTGGRGTPPARSDPRAGSTALLLATIFFMAIFPTLRWQEFSSTLESLNIGTALEIRDTGHWLVPTLQGETRLAKPPLPAWLTAAVIPADTLAGMSSTDRDARLRAAGNLAMVVRSLALLFAAGTLLATFAMGRLLFDDDVGLVALIVAGTNVLMLRFGRVASTDIQLTFWVTAANALFCLAAIRQRWALGLIGGGVALAAAMMSKGPVCLAQTVAPMLLYALIAPRRVHPPRRFLIAGIVAFVVIGLAWYALMVLRVPHALQIWKQETTGYSDLEPPRTSIFHYAVLVPSMAPWIVFFCAALLLAFRRRDPRDRLLLLMIFVPIVVMSCIHDRYDRYLLPMIPACAILTARELVVQARALAWNAWDKAINALHWLSLAAIAIGLPIVGLSTRWLKTAGENPQPWFTHATAWQSAATAAVIIVVAIFLQRRTRTMLILATGVLMLGLQSLFMSGYAKSPQGRSDFRPLAELIWSLSPDVKLYHTDPKGRRAPIDLSIYLNRPILLVKDISELPTGSGPVGVLIPQPKGAAEPVPSPEWTRIVNKQHDENRWWFFLHNSASNTKSD